MSPNVAITGGHGFIGRHVVAQLERRGITPLVAGRRQAPADRQASFVRLDIRSPPQDAFDQLGRPDVLIHLAWGGLPNYQSSHHIDEEFPAHFAFLRQLVEAGLQNLLVAGTCFEYGMQYGPLGEHLPDCPGNPYALAKSTLRHGLIRLQTTIPFNLTWARLFYLFGPGQSPNSLLPQLRSAVERGESTFSMSGGEQLRDYLAVEQAADHLVGLALQMRDIGVVNVCSGRPVSVRSLVERWIAENSWAITLNLGGVPYSPYEPMAFWGDRRKLDSCLGAP